jgi:hypothetical protein
LSKLEKGQALPDFGQPFLSLDLAVAKETPFGDGGMGAIVRELQPLSQCPISGRPPFPDTPFSRQNTL